MADHRRNKTRGAEWRRGYNAGVAALSALVMAELGPAIGADATEKQRVKQDEIRKSVRKLARRHNAALKLCEAVSEFQKVMAEDEP